VFERIESCGVEISDDCGRDVPEQVQYGNAELASATTDALGLFLNEIRRFDLLSARTRWSWRSASSRATARRPNGW
jgi:hypothetical protein